MSAFPLRPTRQIFGPTMRDERPVSDPKRMVGADTFNFAFWQAAGISQTAPLVTMAFDMQNDDAYSAAAAWDSEQFGYAAVNDPLSPLLITAWQWIDTAVLLGDFRYEIQFVDQVPNQEGDLVDLNFEWGWVEPIVIGTGGFVLLEPSVVIEQGPGGKANLVTFAVRVGEADFGSGPVVLSLW